MKEKAKPPLSIGAEFLGFQFRSSTCIDWLQLDVRGSLKKTPAYDTKDTGKSTAVFNKLYEVRDGKYYIASIVSEPIEAFLPPDMNLIKLINRELYYQLPVNRIIEISLNHNLVPMNASRIDFSIDFNTFINNQKPERFIKKFINNDFLKIGMNSGALAFDNKTYFKSHALKFMKKDSNITVNLYNKSKEMKDVKNKPWIINSWKNAGLDLTKDVWRLEFSIHRPKFKYIDKETGEYEQFNYQRLDDKKYLNKIIEVLISKYFDFRRNTGIKSIYDMPKVLLFPNIGDFNVVFDRCESLESEKKDLKFYKKLKELNNEVREISKHLSDCNSSLIKYYKNSRQL